MVWVPTGCPICGSDKRSPTSVCGHCHDRDAEADAIHRAREAFARDQIDQAELERRIQVALTDAPRPSWSGTVLRMR